MQTQEMGLYKITFENLKRQVIEVYEYKQRESNSSRSFAINNRNNAHVYVAPNLRQNNRNTGQNSNVANCQQAPQNRQFNNRAPPRYPYLSERSFIR